ncbi:MAG: hypothetical protein WBP93_15400 [Pyrinomonadaceae bacterium]
MLALKQKESEQETPPGKNKLRWDVIFSDLSLLISLWLARFIIWQTLRRRRKERARRRKHFKLIRGSTLARVK